MQIVVPSEILNRFFESLKVGNACVMIVFGDYSSLGSGDMIEGEWEERVRDTYGDLKYEIFWRKWKMDKLSKKILRFKDLKQAS